MRSKTLTSFLIASLVFLIFFQVEAFATITSTGESKATITFQDISITDPLDPEKPTKPLDPTDPNNPTDDTTGNAGPLSLDYVSSIDFGTQNVDINKEQTYESTSLKPFIQITDNRGTGAGWKVTAAASSFNDGTKDTLSGAVITLNKGEVVSPITGLAAPTPVSSIVLETTGEAVEVVKAPAETGKGTWLNRWFPTLSETRTFETLETNDNVTLDIPAGAATVGTHTATITWTLTDAPGQE